MSSFAGHHADINLRLAHALISRGHQVTIYANTFFPSANLDLKIAPLTTDYPYDIVHTIAKNESLEHQIKAFQLEASGFSNNLKNVDSADITIFPTLLDYQLFSIGEWQHDLGRLIACIHADPIQFNSHGAALWKMAFDNCSRKKDSLMIGTLEPEVCLAYKSLVSHNAIDIKMFPIPHDGGIVRDEENQLRTIGILGHQRPDKGFDSIPRVVTRLIQSGFRVIVQNSSLVTDNAILKIHPNLEVMGHVENLSDLISRCSLILLNYKKNSYRVTGSGIAWEALASGVPILAPQGTSIAKLIKQYTCGEVFDSDNNESLHSMITVMQENYPHYKRNSKLARDQYHRTHGTNLFIDFILSNNELLI